MENTYKVKIQEAYDDLVGANVNPYIAREYVTNPESDKSKLVRACIEAFLPKEIQNKVNKNLNKK